MITYLQAIILGFFQGITELFPVSSLGHSVLIASLFGWHNILNDESKSESFFLSYLVILHVATALALLLFYRHTWIRIIKGFFRSLRTRKTDDPDSKMAWLLIVATIPAGVFGLAFEHILRTQFAKPLSAIIFLMLNGFLLLAGDRYIESHRPRKSARGNARAATVSDSVARASEKLTFKRALFIGVAQIGALFAGISRSGITMISGIYSGLDHEDAARFSFLLATPIILAAGLIKLPDFFSSLDAGVRGQIVVGGITTAVAAYIAVKYLDKYFQDRRLRPFGLYCISFASFMLLVSLIRGHF